MTSYLERLEAAPAGERWAMARGWMQTDPLPFYAELRTHRPVLALPEVTLVTRHVDCVEVLTRHDALSVQPYAPKQGSYWMAQDDTAQHWREKAVMQAVLDRETVPEIRAWAAEECVARLTDVPQPFDAVAGLTRAVPIAMVQRWFGFDDADPEALFRWSYWNQMDAFWNQPFDHHPDAAGIVARREAGNLEMREYLVALVRRRAAELQAGGAGRDPVSRLLQLAGSRALNLDVPAVVLNVGGLLIGAVETISHASVNALDHLLADPARAAAARADLGTPAFDGHVFEALRFRPAFPYFFRTAERTVKLARNTDHATTIPAGATVLAVTHAAMFDPAAFDASDDFRPTRDPARTFTFGLGLHECLGRAIGAAVVPEIVAQALRLPDLAARTPDRRGGPVPESWPWTWQ